MDTTANVKELYNIASIARSATAIVTLTDSQKVPCAVFTGYYPYTIAFCGFYIDGELEQKARCIFFDISSTGGYGMYFRGILDVKNGAITIEDLDKSRIKSVDITYLPTKIL